MVAQESFEQLKAQCQSLFAGLQADIKKEINEVITEMQKKDVQNKATVRPCISIALPNTPTVILSIFNMVNINLI